MKLQEVAAPRVDEWATKTSPCSSRLHSGIIIQGVAAKYKFSSNRHLINIQRDVTGLSKDDFVICNTQKFKSISTDSYILTELDLKLYNKTVLEN